MHFSKKNGFHRMFVTSSHIEKKRIEKNGEKKGLRKRTHVASELFFLYAELWAENTNPQHRHTPLQFQKYFFQTSFETKILHESFEIYGQYRFWPFSVCCFKSYSGVLAFGIFTTISRQRERERERERERRAVALFQKKYKDHSSESLKFLQLVSAL